LSPKESLSVAILSGSPSDAEMVEACAAILDQYGISHESRVLSAHRQPEALHRYVEDTESRGCRLYIAMAGMAAHLPGVVASLTARPVLGVPLPGGVMGGMDALLAVVQMPAGVPVASFAVGKAGARNAAHMAARILSLADEDLAKQVREFREFMADGGR
jgi:5-(carboxyamino)imidazole ribonucleotide mutase